MSLSLFPLTAPSASAPAALELEDTPCLLCGSGCWSPLLEAPDHSPRGSGRRFTVVQCQDCGLCFTNPRPTPAAIGRFYPDDYRPHQPRTPRRINFWRWLLEGNGRRTHGQHQPLPWRARGRLLDFGCGSGAFLEDMHRQGWQVVGVDVSDAVVRHVRQELGLSAHAGSLPHPELEAESFDVVTMWQSLEHVHAPLEVLRAARRLLRPGGKLVVAVPNIDSQAFRWFGPCWHGLDVPRHLTHFAPWTLHLMLERAGFCVGPVQMVRRSGWLRWSARLAARHGQGGRWAGWLQRPLISRLAAWHHCLTSQSDCMRITAER